MNNTIRIIIGSCVVSTLVGAYAWRGPENGNLTFQRCVAIDAKRQQTGSVKVKIDLPGKILA